MEKKKILIWETLATVAGGQKMTLNILDMMSGKYDYCVLIPAEGMLSEELAKRNIPYVQMGDQTLPTGVKGKEVILRYFTMSVKNILKSLAVIHRFRPDILYCPGPAALPWSAVCGSLTGKPVVWHLHHIFLDGTTVKLLNICGSFRSVKKILSISGSVSEQISRTTAKNKIRVLYNPVDTDKYENGDKNIIFSEIEKELGHKIKDDTYIFTNIGTITKNKGQDLFVKTIHELKGRGLDVIGLLVGDVITDADRSYRDGLMEYIRGNGLDHDLYMMGFRKDICDILAATDCVIISSMEGLSMIAMEAMSSGTRVVGMDEGGSGELMRLAKCGEVYPASGDEKEIADAVQRALKQDENKLTSGYEFCLQQNPEQYKRKLLEIFDGV